MYRAAIFGEPVPVTTGTVPQRANFLYDVTEAERAICNDISACQSMESLVQLCRSMEYVVKYGIKGDLVECGVFKGGSIVVMIRMLQALGVQRRIWLYDTFEGMPKPEAVDIIRGAWEVHDGGLKSWEIYKRDDGSGGSNWVYCPIDEVRKYVLATGYPEELLTFVKGKVEDTIPGAMPDRIALLRLDTDFHSSTRHELIHLYPALERGGVLIIDDYGAYASVQKATDEYFSSVPFHLARVDEHVRCGVKV